MAETKMPRTALRKIQSLQTERDRFRAAWQEWNEKTQWVQETALMRELGKHRADVLRERIEALQNRIDAMKETQLEPVVPDSLAWADVKRRLPRKNTEVLVFFREISLPSTGQYTGSASDHKGWCYPKENYLWPGEHPDFPNGGWPTVTHWMPLPPPPTSVVVTVEMPASSVNELARLFQSLVQERTQSSGSQTVIDIDAARAAARAAQEGK